MPRLRPLNFDQIANGDLTERNKAVKDLLMLYPRGPSQSQKKEEYQKLRTWEGIDAKLDAVEPVEEPWNDCKASYYGYTTEQFYIILKAMGQEGAGNPSEWDIRQLVKRIHPEWSKAKTTRGTKRLHNRLTNSWKKALKSGTLGDLIFRASVQTLSVPRPRSISRYDWTGNQRFDIAVPAKTPEEAKTQVQVMFGHAAQVSREPSGWEQGDAAALMSANNHSIASITEKIEEWKERIERAQDHIQNLEMLKDALELYTITAFDENN
jgi:hypothetical protein